MFEIFTGNSSTSFTPASKKNFFILGTNLSENIDKPLEIINKRDETKGEPLKSSTGKTVNVNGIIPDSVTSHEDDIPMIENELLAKLLEIPYLDGVDTIKLSLTLEELIYSHKQYIYILLNNIIASNQIPLDISCELIIKIGQIKDPKSTSNRNWFLENQIRSADPYIREAGALGLYELGDFFSHKTLKEAYDNENNYLLKKLFKKALDKVTDINNNDVLHEATNGVNC